jgi:hypothetical protein
MPAVIFSGNKVKTLKPALQLLDGTTLYYSATDPSSVATAGEPGDVLLSTSSKRLYIKQDSGTNTNWNTSGFTSGTLTQNSVPFVDVAGLLTQDNTNFTWDNTTKILLAKNVTISNFIATGLVHNNSSGVLSSSLLVDVDVSATAAIALSKLASLTVSRLVTSSAAGVLTVSTTTAAEADYLSGVTSAIQTQINGKEPTIIIGTSAQYWRGDKSFQTLDTLAVPENTNLYFTTSRARGTISATSPIFYDSGTGVVSSQAASGTQAGYLSSADWSTFNGKQAAGSYITALTSDVSASGPGSVAATVNSVGGSSAANVNAATLLANAATNLNTVSTIVFRDASGNFSAGTITANLTGNASGTAANITGIAAIANGGTALSSIPTNGQFLIGNGTGYTLAAITGTANQITVTPGGGSSTLSLPQDVATTSAPTFYEVKYKDTGNAFYTSLRGSSSATGNLIFILPKTAPTVTNQALVSTTLGVMSFKTVPLSSVGDMDEATFSVANSIAVATSITGLVFSNAATRSAKVIYSLFINATSALYETGELNLIQKAASWDIAQSFSGDDSGVTFSITSAGQVQYTSSTYPGFTSGKLEFRSITTTT